MIGGCINKSQVNLKYMLEVSSSSPELALSDSAMTESTTYSYVLPVLLQEFDLEITIIPNLPVLGLSGSVLSTSVHIGK